jgi:hypothetical protein
MVRAHRNPAKARNLPRNATPEQRAAAHQADASSLYAWSLGNHPEAELIDAERRAAEHLRQARKAEAEAKKAKRKK